MEIIEKNSHELEIKEEPNIFRYAAGTILVFIGILGIFYSITSGKLSGTHEIASKIKDMGILILHCAVIVLGFIMTTCCPRLYLKLDKKAKKMVYIQKRVLYNTKKERSLEEIKEIKLVPLNSDKDNLSYSIKIIFHDNKELNLNGRGLYHAQDKGNISSKELGQKLADFTMVRLNIFTPNGIDISLVRKYA